MVERKLENINSQIEDFIKSGKMESFEEFLDLMLEEMDEFEISFNRELAHTESANHPFYRRSLSLNINKSIRKLQKELSQTLLSFPLNEDLLNLKRNDKSLTHFNQLHQKYLDIYYLQGKSEIEKKYLISIEMLSYVKEVVSTHFADQPKELTTGLRKVKPEMEEEWLSSEAVSHLLGVTTRTITEYTSKGLLPVYQPSKKVKFYKRSDVNTLLENSKKENYHKAS